MSKSSEQDYTTVKVREPEFSGMRLENPGRTTDLDYREDGTFRTGSNPAWRTPSVAARVNMREVEGGPDDEELMLLVQTAEGHANEFFAPEAEHPKGLDKLLELWASTERRTAAQGPTGDMVYAEHTRWPESTQPVE